MNFPFVEVDFTDEIKQIKANQKRESELNNCPHCKCMPCICGSRTDNPHRNLEQLAKKLNPLVDEINEELVRHAAVCKKKMWADKDAGYPPNCKKGFVEKDGKCVPEKVEESDSKKYGVVNFNHPKHKSDKRGKRKSYSELWKKVNEN